MAKWADKEKPKVAGYTPLSAEQVVLMNQNKLLEELVMRQIDRHELFEAVDKRSVAVARTALQDAFMWLNRSVAKPQRIEPTTETVEKFEDDAGNLIDMLMRS
jgi:hypothetical protein